METQLEFDFSNNIPNTDPVIDDKRIPPFKKKTNELTTVVWQNKIKMATNTNTHTDTLPNIITNIMPSYTLMSMTPKILSQRIKTLPNLKIIVSSQYDITPDDFMHKGSNTLQTANASEYERIALRNELQKWKLTSFSAIWNDLANGIYKYVSMQKYFEGIDAATVKDKETGDPTLYKWIIKMTLPQILKAAFGGLVDMNGNFLYGYGDFLKQTVLKELFDIFAHIKAEPDLIYIKIKGLETPVYRQYTPLHLSDIQNGIFTFELDPFYFTFDIGKEDGKDIPIKSDDRFIDSIAGCYAACVIGRHQITKSNKQNEIVEKLPTALTAYRYYQTIQGAANMQSLLGISLETKNDRYNVRLQREGLLGIFDSDNFREKAIKTKKDRENEKQGILKDYKYNIYGDFKKASQDASKCALILRQGIDKAGLMERLIKDPRADKIYLPATEKPMQYITEYKNCLIAKLDKITEM